MKTIINILKFNVLFDVDGKRFFLYTNAIDHCLKNKSKQVNVLNLFTGWHVFATRDHVPL